LNFVILSNAKDLTPLDHPRKQPGFGDGACVSLLPLPQLPHISQNLPNLRLRKLTLKCRHTFLPVSNYRLEFRICLLLHFRGMQIKRSQLLAQRGLRMTIAAMAQHAVRLKNVFSNARFLPAGRFILSENRAPQPNQCHIQKNQTS
jgi:hypothetical protein